MSQPWILAAERSGLLTRIVMTGSVLLCNADEKLTAFLEVESVLMKERLYRFDQFPDDPSA
jgi:hypothetical protein